MDCDPHRDRPGCIPVPAPGRAPVTEEALWVQEGSGWTVPMFGEEVTWAVDGNTPHLPALPLPAP